MNSDICLFLTSYLHRLADTTFYEFIPCDLHKMLQDVTFPKVYKISDGMTQDFGLHDYEFRPTLPWSSGEMTFDRFYRFPG